MFLKHRKLLSIAIYGFICCQQTKMTFVFASVSHWVLSTCRVRKQCAFLRLLLLYPFVIHSLFQSYVLFLSEFKWWRAYNRRFLTKMKSHTAPGCHVSIVADQSGSGLKENQMFLDISGFICPEGNGVKCSDWCSFKAAIEYSIFLVIYQR